MGGTALRHFLGGKELPADPVAIWRIRVVPATSGEMSEYFESLDPAATARYLAKLRLLGLTEKDDPFASCNDQKFVDDMRLWPPVEYAHIFCYFIDRPGVYTRQQLMQWKSMEAYNFFKSGHVRTVQFWRVSTTISILKATVNPSQRAPEKAHHAWVSVKNDGEILTAHCTCMAG